MSYRQYCVFSRESLAKMQGIRGKICTQAGHAYLHSYLDACLRFPLHVEEYLRNGDSKKITCVMETDTQVKELFDKVQSHCGAVLIVDNAHTVFDQPTQTCLGIGPLPDGLVQTLSLDTLKLLT